LLSDAPAFWWRPAGWRSALLRPAGAIYGTIASWRMRNAPRVKVDMAVVCVGNPTVGGSGKTPLALALAARARRMGLKPGFLSRGHGGASSHPQIVDPERHSSRLVGDEPLLLAARGPVAVGRDRVAGARLLAAEGCDLAIMDDGFQSGQIHADYALLVIDARFGLGNGGTLPAGPLRAPFEEQLLHADAVLRMGEGEGADAPLRLAARAAKPVFDAVARPVDAGRMAGRRVLAFAGIGLPERFFETLRQAGAEIVVTRAFPDHHDYAPHQLADLAEEAAAQDLHLVTTAKDGVRISDRLAPPGFREALDVLEVKVRFAETATPERILSEAVERWRKRRLAG
jgi:tetraacyldisaccharide 4'-kinase